MRSFRKVVAGYDGTASGRNALALAELVARTANSDLIVVRVHDRSTEAERRSLLRDLSKEVDAALQDSSISAQALVLDDRSPARALHELARQDPLIGLIVVGSTHRAGLGQVVPGSVAQRLLNGGPCPVAIAPRLYLERSQSPSAGVPRGLAEHLRVVAVAFDGSSEAGIALELGAAIAAAARSTLRVIAVGEPAAAGNSRMAATATLESTGPDLQSRLHDVVADLPRELRALPIYERGNPALKLLERAEEGVDLLVIGSRGYGPLRATLIGGVSASVIAHAPCPVIICPRPAAEGDR